MPLDTRPADLDASGDPDAWAAFRVSHPQERLRLLRQLCDSQVPVMLNLPDGSAAPSTLWSVDVQTQRLSFTAEGHESALERLVEANEGVAVAYLESVKLQFDLQGLMLVRGARHKALQGPFPSEIYRFQRRNAYRVRNGLRSNALAHFRHPGLPEMNLELRLLDVSIGGCALWLPSDVPPLPPGTRLGEVLVVLDGETRFSAPARLQHITAVGTSERIADGARIGCEWLGLPGSAERILQRWIDRSQHRQRLLAC